MHRTWDHVKKINNRLVWISILLLFFSSLFPYTTTLVASNFDSAVAQAIYGIIVMLVSFCNVWMYRELSLVSTNGELWQSAQGHNIWMRWDIGIKVIGLILTLTIFPPAMMWSVLLTAICIVIPRSI